MKLLIIAVTLLFVELSYAMDQTEQATEEDFEYGMLKAYNPEAHLVPRNSWMRVNIQDLFANTYLLHAFPADIQGLLWERIKCVNAVEQLLAEINNGQKVQCAFLRALTSDDERLNNPYVLRELLYRGAQVNAFIDKEVADCLKVPFRYAAPTKTPLVNASAERDLAAEKKEFLRAFWAGELGGWAPRTIDGSKQRLNVCEGFSPVMLCALFRSEKGIINLMSLSCELVMTNKDNTANFLDALILGWDHVDQYSTEESMQWEDANLTYHYDKECKNILHHFVSYIRKYSLPLVYPLKWAILSEGIQRKINALLNARIND